MIGIVMSETCWAVSARQGNKILWLIVASGCLFYSSQIFNFLLTGLAFLYCGCASGIILIAYFSALLPTGHPMAVTSYRSSSTVFHNSYFQSTHTKARKQQYCTTPTHLAPRLRMNGANASVPFTCLHGVER
jgi:hypothetical protein